MWSGQLGGFVAELDFDQTYVWDLSLCLKKLLIIFYPDEYCNLIDCLGLKANNYEMIKVT